MIAMPAPAPAPKPFMVVTRACGYMCDGIQGPNSHVVKRVGSSDGLFSTGRGPNRNGKSKFRGSRVVYTLSRRQVVSTAPQKVNVTVIDECGQRHDIVGDVGTNLLDLCHQHKLELEGACDATLACSTCHVIIDQENFDKLDEPEDEELDMLDLAFGLEDTSRLGCQVVLRPELEGMVFRIPSSVPPYITEGG